MYARAGGDELSWLSLIVVIVRVGGAAVARAEVLRTRAGAVGSEVVRDLLRLQVLRLMVHRSHCPEAHFSTAGILLCGLMLLLLIGCPSIDAIAKVWIRGRGADLQPTGRRAGADRVYADGVPSADCALVRHRVLRRITHAVLSRPLLLEEKVHDCLGRMYGSARRGGMGRRRRTLAAVFFSQICAPVAHRELNAGRKRFYRSREVHWLCSWTRSVFVLENCFASDRASLYIPVVAECWLNAGSWVILFA